MLKYGWFVALLLLPGIVQAETDAHAPASKPATAHSVVQQDPLEEAVDALKTFLKPYVHQSTRAVHTYHYATKESLKVDPLAPLDFEDPKVKDHVKNWSAYFWSSKQPLSGGKDAKSLYLAQDPYASRDFGGEHWAMYRLILPTETRFLDLAFLDRNQKEFPLPEEVAQLLDKAGCRGDAYSGIDDLMRKFGSEGCRRVLLRVLKELDLDAILYDWNRAHMPAFKPRRGSAVMLLKTDKLGPESIAIYDAQGMSAGGSEADRKRIEGMYRSGVEFKQNYNNEERFPKKLWGIDPEMPSKQWVNEKLLGSETPLW